MGNLLYMLAFMFIGPIPMLGIESNVTLIKVKMYTFLIIFNSLLMLLLKMLDHRLIAKDFRPVEGQFNPGLFNPKLQPQTFQPHTVNDYSPL